jgi:hypothetical protein
VAREVEHHRERVERLADRLARDPFAVLPELGDESGDVDRRRLVDAPLAETGQDAVQVDAVGRVRSVGRVDAREPPAFGDLGEGRRP